MTEQIGKVKLDLSFYPGEDFYCDGTVEDEILDIGKKKIIRRRNTRKIEEKRSWPVFHAYLSRLQWENIGVWLPMDKNTKVLEVGSGMGASSSECWPVRPAASPVGFIQKGVSSMPIATRNMTM